MRVFNIMRSDGLLLSADCRRWTPYEEYAFRAGSLTAFKQSLKVKVSVALVAASPIRYIHTNLVHSEDFRRGFRHQLDIGDDAA